MKKIISVFLVMGISVVMLCGHVNQSFSETIYGCVNKRSGALRIVASLDKCRTSENPLTIQAEPIDSINCTPINSLPYTVTTEGIYCLTSDLTTAMTTGNAIEIQANNVVIDLNGHSLSGQAAGLGTHAVGIYAFQWKNIVIRNGTVSGFYRGIFLNDDYPNTTSQSHLIEGVRAVMNPYTGIHVEGLGCIIRNNQVVSTGGCTYDDWVYGIRVFGPGARILNNDVIETKEQSAGTAFGISVDSASGSVVENNRVGNDSLGTGTSIAIDVASSANVLVSNNRVIKMNYGIWYHLDSSGKYRDNLTSEAPFPGVAGGTDAGGNN